LAWSHELVLDVESTEVVHQLEHHSFLLQTEVVDFLFFLLRREHHCLTFCIERCLCLQSYQREKVTKEEQDSKCSIDVLSLPVLILFINM